MFCSVTDAGSSHRASPRGGAAPQDPGALRVQAGGRREGSALGLSALSGLPPSGRGRPTPELGGVSVGAPRQSPAFVGLAWYALEPPGIGGTCRISTV